MKSNPVYKREKTIRSRSFRMPFIILVFNGILAAAVLLNMYQTVEQAKISVSIQYASFLQLYAFVAILEFLLLMFITPALTSGSISGERERQTLELLFTTKMSSADIVLGKLMSAFNQLMILIISSFPVILLSFVYGSVNFMDLGLLLICFITVALFTGSVGMLFSVCLRKSTISNVCTYGVLVFFIVGSYIINLFVLNMNQMQINNMIVPMGEVRPVADTGAMVYLLLMNPVATFAEILGNQVSGSAGMLSIRQFFGGKTENFLVNYWIPVSLAVQTAVSSAVVYGAIHFLNPTKNEKK